MKRNLTIAILAAMAATTALPAGAFAAATITVEPVPGQNVYTPSNATLDLGDGSFDWQWGPDGKGAADIHNVLERGALFSSGDAVASRPTFSVTASAGSYKYFCSIHLGMQGVVSVRPVAAGDSGSGPIKVNWANSQTTTGNRFDLRYRTGKKWKTWQKKTKKKAGKFGKKKKPAKVKKGKAYEFQARSRQGSDKSSWSPTLQVQR